MKKILFLNILVILSLFGQEDRASFIVHGNSMMPVINPKDNIEVIKDFYISHPIERDDIVVLEYSNEKNPIVKRVKGIPGDTLELELKGKSNAFIHINKHRITNSNGECYVVDKNAIEMLSLYIHDYKSIIPNDAVLILGEKPDGTFDSTRIGLANIKDILGKVVKVNDEHIE